MHLQGLYMRDENMKKENNLIFQDLGGGETKKYNGMTTEFAIFSGCKKSNHLFNIFSFNTSLQYLCFVFFFKCLCAVPLSSLPFCLPLSFVSILFINKQIDKVVTHWSILVCTSPKYCVSNPLKALRHKKQFFDGK